jgi:hypothetical protein
MFTIIVIRSQYGHSPWCAVATCPSGHCPPRSVAQALQM